MRRTIVFGLILAGLSIAPAAFAQNGSAADRCRILQDQYSQVISTHANLEMAASAQSSARRASALCNAGRAAEGAALYARAIMVLGGRPAA